MQDLNQNRRFVLWDYHPSLQQLLIRSPKSDEDPKSENIDLIFRGVFYVQTSNWFRGLKIEKPTTDEIEKIKLTTGVSQDVEHQYFILATSGHRFIVGAATLTINQNSYGFRESDIATFP